MVTRSEPREGTRHNAWYLISLPLRFATVAEDYTLKTMSQADLEADIFKHCMPFGQALSSASSNQQPLVPTNTAGRHKRQRPSWTGHRNQPPPRVQTSSFPAPPSYSTGPQSALQDPTVQIMGKLLLRHEEFISHLRKDMGFVMFFRQDKSQSVLPSFMEVARAHREKVDQGSTEIKSPLRTLLLNCLLKELLQRTQQVCATEEGRQSLQAAQWLTQDNQWNYLRWDGKQRKLVPDTRRDPLSHENAVRTITELQNNMKGTGSSPQRACNAWRRKAATRPRFR